MKAGLEIILHALPVEAINHTPESCLGSQAETRMPNVLESDLVSKQISGQCGFTLMELITIMVIVGILAVAALPRFLDSNAFQERGAADQIRAAFRYAQKAAIAQHRNISVIISSATTANCDTLLVGGNFSCVILNSVVVVPALPQTVTFNALGQPVPNAAVAITVGTANITIDQETGYVR